jgi:hypothetical protein
MEKQVLTSGSCRTQPVRALGFGKALFAVTERAGITAGITADAALKFLSKEFPPLFRGNLFQFPQAVFFPPFSRNVFHPGTRQIIEERGVGIKTTLTGIL